MNKCMCWTHRHQKKLKLAMLFFVVVGVGLLLPNLGFCSVEGTLTQIQSKLIGVILPAAAIFGLVFAGLSFVAGNPGARAHLMLAIVGAIIGFGAPSIVTFIQQMVR